jgi:hypothetical protein
MALPCNRTVLVGVERPRWRRVDVPVQGPDCSCVRVLASRPGTSPPPDHVPKAADDTTRVVSGEVDWVVGGCHPYTIGTRAPIIGPTPHAVQPWAGAFLPVFAQPGRKQLELEPPVLPQGEGRPRSHLRSCHVSVHQPPGSTGPGDQLPSHGRPPGRHHGRPILSGSHQDQGPADQRTRPTHPRTSPDLARDACHWTHSGACHATCSHGRNAGPLVALTQHSTHWRCPLRPAGQPSIGGPRFPRRHVG